MEDTNKTRNIYYVLCKNSYVQSATKKEQGKEGRWCWGRLRESAGGLEGDRGNVGRNCILKQG